MKFGFINFVFLDFCKHFILSIYNHIKKFRKNTCIQKCNRLLHFYRF